jgi:hypothetical protein
MLKQQQQQQQQQQKQSYSSVLSNDEYYCKVFHRKAFPIIPTVLARSGKEGYKSFPSGDAMSSVCFAIPLAYMKFSKLFEAKLANMDGAVDDDLSTVIPTILAVCSVVLSCIGRVYFLAHHVLDVLVGALIPVIFHGIFTWANVGIYDLEWWYPLASISVCLSVLGTLVFISMLKASSESRGEMTYTKKKIQSPHQQRSALRSHPCWKLFVSKISHNLNISASMVLLPLAVITFAWVLCQADSPTAVDLQSHHRYALTPPRPLNAVQLAVGTWDVTIRSVGLFGDIESRIFPHSTMQSAKDLGRRKNQKNNRGNMRCYLSIAEDGTFVLKRRDDPSDSFRASFRHPTLPMRGRWKVMPNPHCVTDRFYDEISLESYPRQQIGRKCILQTVKMTFHGYLWGKNGMGKGGKKSFIALPVDNSEYDRRPYGRLTHGTLAWIESVSPNEDMNRGAQRFWNSWLRRTHRPILASISGERISTEPIHEPWCDQ